MLELNTHEQYFQYEGSYYINITMVSKNLKKSFKVWRRNNKKTIKSLEGFENKPLILVLGPKHKSMTYVRLVLALRFVASFNYELFYKILTNLEKRFFELSLPEKDVKIKYDNFWFTSRKLIFLIKNKPKTIEKLILHNCAWFVTRAGLNKIKRSWINNNKKTIVNLERIEGKPLIIKIGSKNKSIIYVRWFLKIIVVMSTDPKLSYQAYKVFEENLLKSNLKLKKVLKTFFKFNL